MSAKKNIVFFAVILLAAALEAREWRMTLLIDSSGLSKEAYSQIYKAITTEWPIQTYTLQTPDISTKEIVTLQAVLFGIETYAINENQMRLLPLSGQNKAVHNTQISVIDSASDSLIDTIVEKHKPLKEQFREQVETVYLAKDDGVILFSLCPNLSNFQNGLSASGREKLQAIKLVQSENGLLNSALLSRDIKAERVKFDTRMTKAIYDPKNYDRILENTENLRKDIVTEQLKSKTLEQQLEKLQQDVKKSNDLLHEVYKQRDEIVKGKQVIAVKNETLDKQISDIMSAAAEEKKQMQDKWILTEQNATKEIAKLKNEIDKLQKKQAIQDKKNENNNDNVQEDNDNELSDEETEAELNKANIVVSEKESNSRGVVFIIIVASLLLGFIFWSKATKPKLKFVYKPTNTMDRTVTGLVAHDGTSDIITKTKSLEALRIEFVYENKSKKMGYKLKSNQGSKIFYRIGEEGDPKEIPAVGTTILAFGTSVGLFVGQAEMPVGFLEVKRNV